MSAGASQGGERARGAELVAALCLATDLGMGFPFEHGLRSTLIAMRLADRLGVDRETRWQTYYHRAAVGAESAMGFCPERSRTSRSRRKERRRSWASKRARGDLTPIG